MRKNKITNIAIAAYGITGILELIALQFDLSIWNHIAKPLLMPLLALYYYTKVKGEGGIIPSRLVIVSLIFSWGGDVLLLYQEHATIYFLLGLSSFLIAHLLYIMIYIRMTNKKLVDQVIRPRLIRYDFFILIIWFVLIWTLFPVLGEMKVPVLIYSIVITAMALAALHRFQKTSVNSFWLVMIGALVFMLSDSLIAINKFLLPIVAGDILIMTTYMVAQYLILSGLIAHQKSHK